MAKTTRLEYIQIAAIIFANEKNTTINTESLKKQFHEGYSITPVTKEIKDIIHRIKNEKVGKKGTISDTMQHLQSLQYTLVDKVPTTLANIVFGRKEVFYSLFSSAVATTDILLTDGKHVLRIEKGSRVPPHITELFPEKFLVKNTKKQQEINKLEREIKDIQKNAIDVYKGFEALSQQHQQDIDTEISDAENDIKAKESKIATLIKEVFAGSPVLPFDRGIHSENASIIQRVCNTGTDIFEMDVVGILTPDMKENRTIYPNIKVQRAWWAAAALYKKAQREIPWNNLIIYHQKSPFTLTVKDNALKAVLKYFGLGNKSVDGINEQVLSPVDLLLVDRSKAGRIEQTFKKAFPTDLSAKDLIEKLETSYTGGSKKPLEEQSYRELMKTFFIAREMVGVSLKQPDYANETQYGSGVVKLVGMSKTDKSPLDVDPITLFYEKYIGASPSKQKDMIDKFIDIHFDEFDLRPSVRSWTYPITFDYGALGITPFKEKQYKKIKFKLFTWAAAGFNGQWTSGGGGYAPENLLPSNWTGGIGVSATNRIINMYYPMDNRLLGNLATARINAFNEVAELTFAEDIRALEESKQDPNADTTKIDTEIQNLLSTLNSIKNSLKQIKITARGVDLDEMEKALNKIYASRQPQYKALISLHNASKELKQLKASENYSEELEKLFVKMFYDNDNLLIGMNHNLKLPVDKTKLKAATLKTSLLITQKASVEITKYIAQTTIGLKNIGKKLTKEDEARIKFILGYGESAKNKFYAIDTKNRNPDNFVFLFKTKVIDSLFSEMRKDNFTYSWGRWRTDSSAARERERPDISLQDMRKYYASDATSYENMLKKLRKYGSSNIDAHFIAVQAAYFLFLEGKMASQNVHRLKKQIFLSIFGAITKSGHTIFNPGGGAGGRGYDYIFQEEIKKQGEPGLAYFALAPYIVLS